MNDEAELIAAAKAGSVDAFTVLVRGHRERLLRFLLTRSASFADAEDALQDTLIAAYKYLHSYDPRWRFSTWLYRIAVRNVGALRRRDAVNVTGVQDLRDEESDPLLLCMADTETENLWISARRLLNDDVFAAMWLRYAEDMSVRDISQTLDRSLSWTKVNLMRGRQALENELRDEAPGSEAYG